MKRQLALVLAAAFAVTGTWGGLALAETSEPALPDDIQIAESILEEEAFLLSESDAPVALAAENPDIPAGGIITENNFESANPKEVTPEQIAPFTYKDAVISTHADPDTGKALQLTGGKSSTTATAEFSPTWLLDTGGATDASTEGKNALVVTEFDIKFDGLVQTKSTMEAQLSWKDDTSRTFIQRLVFNGSERQLQMYDTSANPKGFANSTVAGVPELEDGRWYRIKIVVHATRSGGSSLKKVSGYIDGVQAFKEMGFISTTKGKVNAYDKLTFTGLSAGGLECNAHIDNFSVFKVNENTPTAPIDKGGLISVLRRADKLHRTAVIGTKEGEYLQENYDTFGAAIEEAKQIYQADDVDADDLEAAQEALTQAMANFQPNGAPITVEHIRYYGSSGNLLTDLSSTDSLDVALSAFAEANANDTESVALAAVLYQKDAKFVNGRPLAVAASEPTNVAKLSARELRARFDLTPYTNHEDLFVKVMLWKDFETLYPWMTSVRAFDSAAAVLAETSEDDGAEPKEPAAQPMQSSQTVISEEETKVTVTVPAAVGADVTLLAARKGMDISDMKGINADNFSQKVSFAGQETAGENNAAVFEFIPQDGSGTYHVYSYCKAADSFRELAMDYFDVGDTKKALDAVYQAGTNGQAVKNALVEKKQTLEIDTPVFNAAVNEGISFDEIAAQINTKHYAATELELFKQNLRQALGLALVNHSASNETVCGVLNRDSALSVAEELGVLENQTVNETKRYEKFLSFDSGRKARMYRTITAGRPYTAQTLRKAMNEAILVAQVGEAKSWDSISTSFADSADFLEGTGYQSLSDNQKGRVCQNVYNNRDVYSMERLLAVVKDAVDAVIANTGSSGGGGGSGSGGSRPSSGGKVSGGYDAIVPNESTNENQVKPMEQVTGSFVDLDDVPWATEAIGVLAARGVIHGVGDGRFAPNEPVKREEFLKMAVSMLDLLDASATAEFEDVNRGEWFYPYVATGYSLGVVNGVSDSLFGAGQELTRQDLALLIYRFGNIANVMFEEDGEYILFDDDEQFTSCGRAAVSVLAKSGIVSGTGANLFQPLASCTRAEAAKMLYAMDKLIIGR